MKATKLRRGGRSRGRRAVRGRGAAHPMPMAKGSVSFRMISFAMKACMPILCHCVIFAT